jgi:hypothetical protein
MTVLDFSMTDLDLSITDLSLVLFVVGLDKDWLVAGDDHHPLRPVLGVLVPCRVGCLII